MGINMCTEQRQPVVMLGLLEAAHLEPSVLYVHIKWT